MRNGKLETIRLGLPSRGKLGDSTVEFMGSCGIRVQKGNERQYQGFISSIPELAVVFQRAGDIVSKIGDGTVTFGVTGYDIVAEQIEENQDILVLYPDLGFGKCDLVVAVPDSWIGVSSIGDISDMSSEMRGKNEKLRIATKFPNLTRDFFYQKGITNFNLVLAEGALESAPNIGYADLIVDLTETGTTLKENRLKQVYGGAILHSQACLIGNRRILRESDTALGIARVLLEMFEAHLRSNNWISVTANVKGESPDDIARHINQEPEIAGLIGPTISLVHPKGSVNQGWYAVDLNVPKDRALTAVSHLRKIGASGIVFKNLTHIFDAECEHYEVLVKSLKRPDSSETWASLLT